MNPNEPQPPVDAGDPPDDLEGRPREIWEELAPILCDTGVLTLADRSAFGTLCMEMALLERLQKSVHRRRNYINERGEPKRHPDMISMRESQAIVLTLEREFGMTPSSRSRVDATPPPPDMDDPSLPLDGVTVS